MSFFESEMIIPPIIDLVAPDKWPNDLKDYLQDNSEIFLGIKNSIFDDAIYGLQKILQKYAITGWHCTRLTEMEIVSIICDGMQLPNAEMLNHRIDKVFKSGLITEEKAVKFKSYNQAKEEIRANKVWFCFFPPHIAGETGISSFFRYWGGEALYNSYDRDPEMASTLNSIGVPCIVEADIPIASLEPNGGLCFKIIKKFFIHHGRHAYETTDHEDRIKRFLPAENIRRIIQYPDPDFILLTSCDEWRQKLV